VTALSPNASAVVSAISDAIEALNSAAVTALGVAHDTVRDAAAMRASTPPFLSVTETPAAPTASARATSILPSKKERKIRGFILGENLLIITQCADKVPREALATRYGVTKRAIYGVWQGRVNTWAAVARGVPLGARCIHLCRFPLNDKLLLSGLCVLCGWAAERCLSIDML